MQYPARLVMSFVQRAIFIPVCIFFQCRNTLHSVCSMFGPMSSMYFLDS